MIRRTFASQTDFNTWHDQVKTATGMPITGRNAATGELQPGKQQTTDYTSLMANTLEAVVGDDRLVKRGLTDGLIREDLLTADEIATLASAYPAWATGEAYDVNDLREHDGLLYRCVQAHTSQPDWTPDTTAALWTLAASPGVIPEWTQPTGSHDAYQTDDLVTHPDKENTMGTGTDTIWVWRSKIDANATEPGQDGQVHRYWEPIEEA